MVGKFLKRYSLHNNILFFLYIQVEAVVYRSNSGDESDYKLLPWAIPKQTFYDYLNSYYKDVIMKNFAPCSNVPQFKGKFQPPWPKRTYIGDKCVFEAEGFPDIVPPGFYKIIFNCTGPDQPSWSFIGIFKIINKMFQLCSNKYISNKIRPNIFLNPLKRAYTRVFLNLNSYLRTQINVIQ